MLGHPEKLLNTVHIPITVGLGPSTRYHQRPKAPRLSYVLILSQQSQIATVLCNMRLRFLLLTTLVAAGNLTPRKGHKGLVSTTSSNPVLALRQSCGTSESACDSLYCIPDSSTCCFDGLGSYCGEGTYCVDGGCCDDGEICDSDNLDITNTCADDEVECDSIWCMPEGSVCCGSGIFCDAGQTCSGIYCDDDTDSVDDGDDAVEDDDTPTLCARKGRGGGGNGGGGGGFDSDDDSDGGDDGCGGASAGSLATPLALTPLVAYLAFLL